MQSHGFPQDPTKPSRKSSKSSKPMDEFYPVPPSKNIPRIVMDPLAVLRQCIRYFSFHPETYGTNISHLISREVMHVMRLQSSEVAIIDQHPVIGSNDMSTAVEMFAKPLLPPLKNGESSEKKGPKPVVGYGALTFLPPPHDLGSVLDKVGKEGPSSPVGESSKNRGDAPFASQLDPSAFSSSGTKFKACSEGSASTEGSPLSVLAPYTENAAGQEVFLSKIGSIASASDGPIIVDASGYEVSALRRQLQHLEAAYNSKCVRLHELVKENDRLTTLLEASEESAEKWLKKYRATNAEAESLRREVEGWQSRVQRDAQSVEERLSIRRMSTRSRRRTTAVSIDPKGVSDLERMTKLWRATEKNLQETRRLLENANKEAEVAHHHLSDAFLYIERLERRVARRDRYIGIASRRQLSLQEKYEKMMWCLREMGTLSGVYSYVDHIMSESPEWTLFIFSHLQRHSGSALYVDEPRAEGESSGVVFGRSSGGGRYLGEIYDTPLIYRLMAEEVTGATERRGRPPALRTNLIGTIACKALRWENLFVLDYLGGLDSNPQSCELNRKRFPLLTLASLTQPLRDDQGVRLDIIIEEPPQSKKDASEKNVKKEAPTVIIPDDAGVPNTSKYDKAAIRLVLRLFWRERVMQFEQTMTKRIQTSIAQARAVRKGNGRARSVDSSTNNEENDKELLPNTFLGALVSHVIGICGTGGKKESEKANLLLAVRGITSKDPNLWDDGRIFFATIADASIRLGSSNNAIPSSDITVGVREMLCAIYYYALEYKDVDADFRLFYLVSHQLIPESVGVNFYACVEAFSSDCETLLKRYMEQGKDFAREGLKADAAPSVLAAGSLETLAEVDQPEQMFSPIEVVGRAMELIDRTPIVAEEKEQEEDSDGDGYGIVLPGAKETGIEVLKSSKGNESVSTVAGEHESHTDIFGSSSSSNQQSLGHNIYEYLESVKHRRTEKQQQEYAERKSKLDAPVEPDADPREAWDALDADLRRIFGPHEGITRRYCNVSVNPLSATLRDNRRRRFIFDHVERKVLGATRGLVPLEDVLLLLHKHCFATYAVACCGAPRLPFRCFKGKRATESKSDYYEPLSRIGAMPALPIHLQRLRVALGLDQPSALIRCQHLFTTDIHTLTPTHFYDELLTLSIDIHLQQQNFIMYTTLRACAARHERYADEGTEECNGSVPVAALKLGFLEAFNPTRLSNACVLALVEHLYFCCSQFVLDDTVRLEQFTNFSFVFSREIVNPQEETSIDKNYGVFDMHDEARECSLLYMSLAVRTLFLVWDPTVVTEAQRFSDILLRWKPFSRIHGFKSRVPPIFQINTPNTPFSTEVQERYLIAAQYLSEGNSGNRNPLRMQTSWVSETERILTEKAKEKPNPEDLEMNFQPPLDKQVEKGLLPNWRTLLRSFRNAIPKSAKPQVTVKARTGKKPTRDGKTGKEESEFLVSFDFGEEDSTTQISSQDTDGMERPNLLLRDQGLFTLSRAIGVSVSNTQPLTDKRSGKKAVTLPPSLELPLRLQKLHYQHCLSLVQGTKLMVSPLIHLMMGKMSESPVTYPQASGSSGLRDRRSLNAYDNHNASTTAPSKTPASLSITTWKPSFQPQPKQNNISLTTFSMDDSGEESKKKDDRKPFFVEELRYALATLSML